MITIVEPKSFISKLWGKQSIAERTEYRLMEYVLRTDYRDSVLLLNVVTGQLVVLEQHELKKINCLPVLGDQSIVSLVENGFLVPDNYDECKKVVGVRRVLRLMSERQNHNRLTHFTILPTTACNARCYYCFEQGVTSITMTEKTADEVVTFIDAHCGEDREVYISWFGGEPTVAANRIDQICNGLQRKKIKYSSNMTTNGYLFDERMVKRAKDLWNLKSVMICVDGVEDNYNKTKAYVNVQDNAYQRVMGNISLLLDSEINVDLRMNFDIVNYSDFESLVNEAVTRFKGSKYLQVRPHPIVGAYPNHQGLIQHGSESWFNEKIVELHSIASSAGVMSKDYSLPCIGIGTCQATSNASVTITAQGNLVKCPEQFGEEQIIGNLKDGILNKSLVDEWKEIGLYDKCVKCVLFPCCVKTKNCAVKDLCCHKADLLNQFKESSINSFIMYKSNNNQEEMSWTSENLE